MARRTRTAKRPAVPKTTRATAAAAPRRDSGQAAPSPRLVWITGALIAVAVAALYLRTAARDIVFGDSPELTGAAITLGVAHPPGYPIWTVIAHVFTLLPIGPLPFRVSVFSVVAAVASVAIAYVASWRLARSIIAAGVAAIALAFAPVVWSWSIVPEVFPLNDAIAAGLIAVLLEWHRTRRPRWFVLAAFVGGLGMANHQTIALVGPAILWLMWVHRREFRGGGLILKAALASAAGLLPYLYLPLGAARSTFWSWGDLASVQDVIGHILRTSYGSAQLVTDVRFQGGAIGDRVVAVLTSFTPAEAVLVVLGAILLYRRDRPLLWFFALAFAVTGPAFAAYSNLDITTALARSVLERFFLLPHVVVAPLSALGIVFAGELARERVGAAWRVRTRSALAALAVAAAVAAAAVSFSSIDESDNHFARHFAEDILATARPNAILLAGGDAVVMPIGYLLSIEGARPDLTFVQIPLLRADWYVRELHREYPALVLRYPKFDGLPGTMRAFIEPNDPARFEVIGGLLDDTMASTHTLIVRGLLSEFRPNDQAVDAAQIASSNTAIMATYRVPTVGEVHRAWDRVILGDYASPPYNVARIYDAQKLYPQARDWYGRALAIDPDFIEARAALAKLPPQ